MTLPVDNLTLAVFRSAEFGFLGFVIPTFRHTPFSSGAMTSRSAGLTGFLARCSDRHPWRSTLEYGFQGEGEK
jgi:hypothetical protein